MRNVTRNRMLVYDRGMVKLELSELGRFDSSPLVSKYANSIVDSTMSRTLDTVYTSIGQVGVNDLIADTVNSINRVYSTMDETDKLNKVISALAIALDNATGTVSNSQNNHVSNTVFYGGYQQQNTYAQQRVLSASERVFSDIGYTKPHIGNGMRRGYGSSNNIGASDALSELTGLAAIVTAMLSDYNRLRPLVDLAETKETNSVALVSMYNRLFSTSIVATSDTNRYSTNPRGYSGYTPNSMPTYGGIRK